MFEEKVPDISREFGCGYPGGAPRAASANPANTRRRRPGTRLGLRYPAIGSTAAARPQTPSRSSGSRTRGTRCLGSPTSCASPGRRRSARSRRTPCRWSGALGVAASCAGARDLAAAAAPSSRARRHDVAASNNLRVRGPPAQGGGPRGRGAGGGEHVHGEPGREQDGTEAALVLQDEENQGRRACGGGSGLTRRAAAAGTATLFSSFPFLVFSCCLSRRRRYPRALNFDLTTSCWFLVPSSAPVLSAWRQHEQQALISSQPPQSSLAAASSPPPSDAPSPSFATPSFASSTTSSALLSRSPASPPFAFAPSASPSPSSSSELSEELV